MHYRNGREAKNGDKIVQIGGYGDGAQIVAVGVLYDAKPGNDYCNGNMAPIQNPITGACMCDCLHVDDLAELLKSPGLTFHKSPTDPNSIVVFVEGTSDPATAGQIDDLLQRLNRPGLDKRPPGK